MADEVDAHCQQLGAHDAHDRSVEGAEGVAPAEEALTSVRVVLWQHDGDAVTPNRPESAADLDPHVRVPHEVSHVVRRVPVLGHDPEGVADKSVADGDPPGPTRTSTGGLE